MITNLIKQTLLSLGSHLCDVARHISLLLLQNTCHLFFPSCHSALGSLVQVSWYRLICGSFRYGRWRRHFVQKHLDFVLDGGLLLGHQLFELIPVSQLVGYKCICNVYFFDTGLEVELIECSNLCELLQWGNLLLCNFLLEKADRGVSGMSCLCFLDFFDTIQNLVEG